MEHAVYICGWRQENDLVLLWVKAHPHIKGIRRDVEAAEEQLHQAITGNGGAVHAVLEFDPPLPSSALEAKYRNPELCLVCGDDSFETAAPKSLPFETEDAREQRQKWLDDFYQKPTCRFCGSATSPRNKNPLPLSYLPPKVDGAFGSVWSVGSTHSEILSESFIELLTVQEKNNLELLPVKAKGQCKFLELIGPSGPRLVGSTEIPLRGWRCPSCGHKEFGHWQADFSIHDFISSSDLPNNLPSVFTIGQQPRVHLCITANRWSELVGTKGTNGLISRPLGVVPVHELISDPDLVLLNKPWWKATSRNKG